MKNSTSPDTDYDLYRLLAQTRTLLSRVREKELYRYGILGRHAAALQAIQAIGDKATPAEVSRWLCREPHTISSLLGRMEEKGLIKNSLIPISSAFSSIVTSAEANRIFWSPFLWRISILADIPSIKGIL